MYRKRMRLWSREIALAVLLTFAAAVFVSAAWLENNAGKTTLARLALDVAHGPAAKP